MASFIPLRLDVRNINDGQKFQDADSVSEKDINTIVQAILYNSENLGSGGGGGGGGVSIYSIEQTTTSTEDVGENIITLVLTNGETRLFYIRNGSKGTEGASLFYSSHISLPLLQNPLTISSIPTKSIDIPSGRTLKINDFVITADMYMYLITSFDSTYTQVQHLGSVGGTKIATGTANVENVSPSSGGYKLGDFYINTRTGDMYKLEYSTIQSNYYWSLVGNMKGADGVGISSFEQTVVSYEDEGENKYEFTLTNGQKYQFSVRNGSKGARRELSYSDSDKTLTID